MSVPSLEAMVVRLGPWWYVSAGCCKTFPESAQLRLGRSGAASLTETSESDEAESARSRPLTKVGAKTRGAPSRTVICRALSDEPTWSLK